MKIFAFLYGFGFCHPTGVRKTCTATCTGGTDKWATYSPNGVTTTGTKF